jgi:hypothetical protein
MLQHITAAVPGVVYQCVVGPGAECRFAFMSGRAGIFRRRGILADPSRWWAIWPRSYEQPRARAPTTLLGPAAWISASAAARTSSAGCDIATFPRATDRIIWNGVIIDFTDRKRLEEELLHR